MEHLYQSSDPRRDFVELIEAVDLTAPNSSKWRPIERWLAAQLDTDESVRVKAKWIAESSVIQNRLGEGGFKNSMDLGLAVLGDGIDIATQLPKFEEFLTKRSDIGVLALTARDGTWGIQHVLFRDSHRDTALKLTETIGAATTAMTQVDTSAATSARKADFAFPASGRHLNTILYGPPGTGKTYRTASEAVRICTGQTFADRAATMARYQELRDEGRIEFVTFHQSFGYEDFVEGIRPVLADDDERTYVSDAGDDEQAGGVRYECRDGIFKRLCAAARATTTSPVVPFDFDPAATKCWKMSLGEAANPDHAEIYDECIERGQALLGYGGQIDFAGCDTRSQVEARLLEKRPGAERVGSIVRYVNMFKNSMSQGDLVVVTDGNRKFRAIGRVSGEYRLIDRDEYSQMRSVEWLAVFEESLPAERIITKTFSQSSLYRLKPRILKVQAIRELLAGEAVSSEQNYVLVIDEINRGNISNILGELITLLEPDKRLGRDNELTVQLPYSGETFGVPANLHIVGTMNTADRSIALLDVALRRRFRFEEMLPDADVIRRLVGTSGVVDGVDVAALLTTINERVELLYDRDHQIGHSFFLGVLSLSDLRTCFVHEVVPLLQEYFYEDWHKICVVLGCPFDRESGQPVAANVHPIIEAQPLSADSLPGASQLDYDNSIRCSIAPGFLGASEADLILYFEGLIHASGLEGD